MFTRFSASASASVVLLCAGFALSAQPAYQQAISSSSPLLYYKLNETSGPAINYGSLGSTFNATYFGTIQRGAATMGGDTGAIFDGTDDYLESGAAAPAGLTGNPTFSIETVAVIRCNGMNSNYPPFLHWGTGGTVREVFFGPRSGDLNRIFTGFYQGGAMTSGTTPVGQWMHLVWVRQGGGDASTGSTLYVNGQSVGLTVDTFLCCGSSVPNVTSSPFRINRASSNTVTMTGEIDELALYDRALSGTEVASHYQMLIAPQSAGRGDMNCDGNVNGDDIDGFIIALLDPAGYSSQFATCDIHNGDFTGDNLVTSSDVSPFIQRLFTPPASNYAQTVLTDSPLLFYRFGEGASTAHNYGSLGTTYDAIYFGSPTMVQSISGDGAVAFAGPNDYLQTGPDVPAAMTGNPTFTAEAIYLTTCTVQLYPPLLGWGTSGTGNEVYFSPQSIRADRFYAGFFNAGLRTVDSLPPAQWTHVVWVRQGGGDSETGTTLYVNGQAVALTHDSDLCCGPLTPTVGSSPFRINRASESVRYFVGAIDELALYDHTLNASQVLAHYNAIGH